MQSIGLYNNRFRKFDKYWTKLSLQVFATDKTTTASGLVYLPEGTAVENITVNKKGVAFEVEPNALSGKTMFKVEDLK